MALSISQYATAVDANKMWESYIYKASTLSVVSATTGIIDLSMTSGIPTYNAYVGTPLTATQMVGVRNTSIYVGPNPPSGSQRFLHSVGVCATGAGSVNTHYMLHDYLMFYSFVDGDNTDTQDMDNPVTLPRYATGAGVRAMVVCQAPMTANGNMTLVYTNSAGVSGRTATTAVVAVTAAGNLATTNHFCELQAGDSGIRSIESVTFGTAVGGFVAIVLVKPLHTLMQHEAGVPVESFPIKDKGAPVEFFNGAFLHFTIRFSLAAQNINPITARVVTTWS